MSKTDKITIVPLRSAESTLLGAGESYDLGFGISVERCQKLLASADSFIWNHKGNPDDENELKKLEYLPHPSLRGTFGHRRGGRILRYNVTVCPRSFATVESTSRFNRRLDTASERLGRSVLRISLYKSCHTP